MDNDNKRTYSKKAALQILRLAASLDEKPAHFSMPSQQIFTFDEIIAAGKDTGINFESIKKASIKYNEIQAMQLSNLTNTHAFEERGVVTKLNKNSLWHEVISELKFRMGEKATVTSKKGLTNEWIFTNRSGVETSAGFTKLEDGAILKFSRRIGIASPGVESFLAAGALSLVIFGYVYVIVEPGLFKSLVILIALTGMLTFTVNKINMRRRERKLKKFQHLVNLVSDAVPYEYEEETPGISEDGDDGEQSPEVNTV